MLVEYGANIDHSDKVSATPLHQTFYRGTIDCLKKLIKYKPDTSILRKNKTLAIDGVFKDNMHEILGSLLNDEEI